MGLTRTAKRQSRPQASLTEGHQTFRSEGASSSVAGDMRQTAEGVEVGLLQIRRDEPRRMSFPVLKAKAQDLAQRLTYLSERMVVVDQDRRGMELQLRSLPPYKDDDQIQFNEIRITKDGISVQRIAFFRKEEVKRQVPLSLSPLDLERLLGDLQAAVA